jgi:hypothetical protein
MNPCGIESNIETSIVIRADRDPINQASRFFTQDFFPDVLGISGNQ